MYHEWFIFISLWFCSSTNHYLVSVVIQGKNVYDRITSIKFFIHSRHFRWLTSIDNMNRLQSIFFYQIDNIKHNTFLLDFCLYAFLVCHKICWFICWDIYDAFLISNNFNKYFCIAKKKSFFNSCLLHHTKFKLCCAY